MAKTIVDENQEPVIPRTDKEEIERLNQDITQRIATEVRLRKDNKTLYLKAEEKDAFIEKLRSENAALYVENDGLKKRADEEKARIFSVLDDLLSGKVILVDMPGEETWVETIKSINCQGNVFVENGSFYDLADFRLAYSEDLFIRISDLNKRLVI